MSNGNGPVNHDIGAYFNQALEIFKQDIVNWIIIGFVGNLAVGVGFWGGFHICTEKALRGEKPTVGDVLAPFSKIGELIVPILIIVALATFGMILCGLGPFIALYFSVLWFWAFPLVTIKNMPWQQAKDTSTALVKANLVPTLILMVVVGFISGLSGIIGIPGLLAGLGGIMSSLAFRAQFGDNTGGGGYGGGAPALPGAGFQGGAAPAWGAPPAAAPAPVPSQGWGAPPAADPNAAWGAAPAPVANQGWGAPPAAPAPDPNQGWGAPPAAPAPAANQGWGAPPAAPAPSPFNLDKPAAAPVAAPPTADGSVETAQPSSGGDDAYSGKTMAMSVQDFDKMLAERNNQNNNGQG
jgi:hypothetical protein